MKIVKFGIFILCFLIVNIHCSFSSAQVRSQISLLEDEISNLINNIENKTFPHNYNMTKEAQVQFLNNETKMQDDILNAFSDLNNDFVILSKSLENETKLNQSEYIRKSDNHSYIQQMENKDFISQLNSDEVNLKNGHLNILKEIRKYIDLIQNLRKSPLKNKFILAKAFSHLKNLYHLYSKFDKQFLKNYHEQLTTLNKQVIKSNKTSKDISKLLNIFERLYNFTQQINQNRNEKKGKKIEIQKIIFIKFQNYIMNIFEVEKKINIIKKCISDKIKAVWKTDLRFYKKVTLISTFTSALKRLIVLNENIIKIKTRVLNSLKRSSVRNIEDLLLMIKSRSGKLNQNEKRIKNIENIFNIAHDISNNREKLSAIRDKIQEKIKIVTNRVHNVKKIKTIRNELDTLLNKLTNDKKMKKLSEIKLGNIKNKLITHLATAKVHDNEMKNMYKMIEDENMKGKKIERIHSKHNVIDHLENLVNMSKEALTHIRENKQKTDGGNVMIQKIVQRLQIMRSEFENIVQNPNQRNSKQKMEDIKKELQNLCSLYKDLKSGSVHNYIRNEVLKRIVNMNSSIINSNKIKRIKLILDYQK
jgi:hypothetical protein